MQPQCGRPHQPSANQTSLGLFLDFRLLILPCCQETHHQEQSEGRMARGRDKRHRGRVGGHIVSPSDQLPYPPAKV